MENIYSAIQRHAVWILLIVFAGTILCLKYTSENLRINTDTENMIDSRVPFRQSWEKYKQEFPFDIDSLLLVIDAQTPEEAERTAEVISKSLRDRPDSFEEVYQPGAGNFFERNALMYLDLPELEKLADRLISVQPLLGRLSHDPSIDTFADTLTRVLVNKRPGLDEELLPVLKELNNSFAGILNGRHYDMSWQRLLVSSDGQRNAGRSYLYVKPRLDFSDLLAAETAIHAVREIVAEHGLDESRGIRVRITGEPALAYEELQSAMRGVRVAGVLALIMVTGVLVIGLGSAWLTVASLLTLVTGLIITAGFATLAVGHLNLISIAFAVLYIGLGVDYAIHICLRYRELLGRGLPQASAIRGAMLSVGGTLMICSLTTATAFYAFLPTTFAGVAELGLISGTGMFINLALNLLLLPVLLGLMPVPRPWHPGRPHGLLAKWVEFPSRHYLLVGTVALALTLVAGFFLPRVHFDRDTLNLREADSESVVTIRELIAQSESSPMSIDILAEDIDSRSEQMAELKAMPSVGRVISLADFVPVVDEEKLSILDELSLTLGADLNMGVDPGELQVSDTQQTLGRLQASLVALDSDDVRLSGQAQRLARQIGQYLSQLRGSNASEQHRQLRDLQDRLLSNLLSSLERLHRALEPQIDGIDSLPEDLYKRWVSERGLQRVNVQPAEPIEQGDGLRRFVEDVQSIAPDATGEPIIMLRAGDTVVRAFQQAFTWAFLLIIGLLLILLRSPVATLYVITPLVLATILSLAALVMLGATLNFANVIALPLLFGIGVDNGIHMVQRARQTRHPEDNPLRTSTARAVLLSALTTMCGFGNLLLSPHPGTASMGLLLTIGTIMTLITTLIILPALLAVWTPARRNL